MSGIAGIIGLKEEFNQERYRNVLDKMTESLAHSKSQVSHSFLTNGSAVSVVLPENFNDLNSRFLQAKSKTCIVDGLVFIDKKIREHVIKEYNLSPSKKDFELLPFAFDLLQEELLKHLSGWFNIFIIDEVQNQFHLFNDKLGYLPMYYYRDNEIFAFSSKIEPIIACNIIDKLELDQASLIEQLHFNYTLSDNTIISGISTLPDACYFKFELLKVTESRYWDVQELFFDEVLNKKNSLDLINRSLERSIAKFFRSTNESVYFSLTGGWDSRVILSYLIPKYLKRFTSYSFGASGSYDIDIPQEISRKEGFEYESFILNDDYLKSDFIKSAMETITLSGGSRNYKRAHYLYAIKRLSSKTNFLLTGIFGDEVFKVGRPDGGTVISKSAIDYIDSGFNTELAIMDLKDSGVLQLVPQSEESILLELKSRLDKLKKRHGKYKTSGQRYFSFRFCLNLRKYFGKELSSYNDFVFCYSPFIDIDFLRDFARTKYMVSRYNFEFPSWELRAQSSWLYYKLTSGNRKSLAYFNSSRGFSMKNTQSLIGIAKIIYLKTLGKRFKKPADGFNTERTETIFKESVGLNGIKNNIFWQTASVPENLKKEEVISLGYYLKYLKEKYEF